MTVATTVASKRILVVDDNEDVLRLIALRLGRCGHEVAVATHARAALDVAESFRPEVGMLDLNLPGMDGCELARQLRTRLGLKLVAVTGFEYDPDKASAFDAYVTKPVRIPVLRSVIDGLF